MVTVKVPYTITKQKEMNLTTREYCNYHANSCELRELIAKENNVNVEDVHLDSNYLNITQGKLDFDNLDE